MIYQMKTNINIFSEESVFQRFLKNSTQQYIKLKFKNKENLISFIQSNFGIKIPKTANYTKISEILKGHSKDFYKDVLGVESPLEIAHLYSFYRLLNTIFWETTWTKTFSPFYKFLFNEDIKIRNKSDQRKYAARIITEFKQLTLQEKWIEYTSTHPTPIFYGELAAPPVIHYEHLTVGPVGFLFSLYYREKDVFGNHEPVLSILVDTTPSGEDIVDWEGTDALKVFTSILKELDQKINKLSSNTPIYNDYLTLIKFEFSYSQLKKLLYDFVKFFKNQIKENKVPLDFYSIVQLTAMFFKDEEVIYILNKLIAEDTLKIKSETEMRGLKITKDGIIKRPESWLAKPAFQLAMDITFAKRMENKDFINVLEDVLKKGAIKYLEEIFDNDFETFKLICLRKGLYRYTTLGKYLIPKKKAIRLVLESYGLRTPSTSSLEERKEIYSFLEKIKEFEDIYKELEEQELIETTINYLRYGRTYFERILKEILFVIISLIIHYEDVAPHIAEGSFILDRPVFYLGYNIEHGLGRIKERCKIFIDKIKQDVKISDDLKRKINCYVKKEKIKFGPYDWYSLVQLSIKYADVNLSKEFWDSLPPTFVDNMRTIVLEIERFFIKESALKWLNLASHEGVTRMLRENTESRQKALNSALRLRETISQILRNFPNLVIITKKVSDAKTGEEYYEAESDIGKILKIYGTRFVENHFPYYIISTFEEKEDVIFYPILITSLADNIF